MKAFFALLAAAIAPFVAAHYTFPDFISNGATAADWVYVRETANHYSNGPVTSVTDPEFRCYELDLENTAASTSIATVEAGSTIGFQAVSSGASDIAFFDIKADPILFSRIAPSITQDAATGKTWFKIYEQAPVFENGALTFPSETQTQFTLTIPKSLPSGQYLVRAEQIALHVASTYGGAQFYIGCAQVNVVNGGSGTPGPLVSIPGVYTGYEPGILINIYDLPSNFTGYQAPGPAIWQG
ncbi:hypothetical protein EW026_g1727 [Hermanssonia centrifuga]|uniref:lytic cellulose monooxygenase (C4-dehydrogenating) n=1 Tax=Hermanssonia centrifuga TaxID=98765 RepID=A0A4S4KRD1_9APHY|nr:hypothetical protein EW026_g1727 [Hermanssonia centrifuga]